MRQTRFVLFFCRFRTHAAFEKLAGISEVERAHGRMVRFVNYGPLTQSLDAYLNCWHPEGIITDTPLYSSKSCPTILIDAEPRLLKKNDICVQYDSMDAGRLAAEELFKEGVENFAFLGSIPPYYWSDERQLGFVEAAAKFGSEVHVYGGERVLGDLLQIQKEVREWILALPKPCGIFAANDQMAEYLLGTCQLTGLKVPDDIAIIGVDNDVTICENSFRTLSSIEPDFRQSGVLAAELLEERIRGKRPSSRNFGSLRIVRRESSRLTKRSDFNVRQALEVIRNRACHGLKARDVLALMRCPRRTAEVRFRAATGMSILEAINEARYERALSLLHKRSLPLCEIATACSFASERMFQRFFKKRAGISPREWRLKAQ